MVSWFFIPRPYDDKKPIIQGQTPRSCEQSRETKNPRRCSQVSGKQNPKKPRIQSEPPRSQPKATPSPKKPNIFKISSAYLYMLNRKQANIEIPQFQTTYQRSDLKLVLTRSSELSEPETTSHNTETVQQKTTPGSRPPALRAHKPESHLGFSVSRDFVFW